MTKEHTIYDFEDYKKYLLYRVGAKSARKGLKMALAKAISCQPTYISQVLNGNSHLSCEQGTSLNEFFGHSKEESHFFLLLLQKARAGNQLLKKYFLEQINDVLDRRLNLASRLGIKNSLSDENKNKFYSSWHFLAITIALTIPSLQTKDALAKHFQLPLKKIVVILEFLISAGIVHQIENHFIANSTILRIGNESPHIYKHHSNWRTQALESLDREEIGDLHYSAVVSLSTRDIRKIKDKILENIKEYVTTIRQSTEEEICVLCIDFFNLKKDKI